MIYFSQGIHPGIKANASLLHNRSVPCAVSALVVSGILILSLGKEQKQGQPYKRLAFVYMLNEKQNLFILTEYAGNFIKVTPLF